MLHLCIHLDETEETKSFVLPHSDDGAAEYPCRIKNEKSRSPSHSRALICKKRHGPLVAGMDCCTRITKERRRRLRYQEWQQQGTAVCGTGMGGSRARHELLCDPRVDSRALQGRACGAYGVLSCVGCYKLAILSSGEMWWEKCGLVRRRKDTTMDGGARMSLQFHSLGLCVGRLVHRGT